MTDLPDTNPKSAFGALKPGSWAIPATTKFHLGQAMADGCRKYGLFNWRENTVAASVYFDAMDRHIEAWKEGEERAKDSGVHHLAHAMACLAIILDAQACGNLIDDRGPPGAYTRLVEQFITDAKTKQWADDAISGRATGLAGACRKLAPAPHDDGA